jgi:hypothetical protein
MGEPSVASIQRFVKKKKWQKMYNKRYWDG